MYGLPNKALITEAYGQWRGRGKSSWNAWEDIPYNRKIRLRIVHSTTRKEETIVIEKSPLVLLRKSLPHSTGTIDMTVRDDKHWQAHLQKHAHARIDVRMRMAELLKGIGVHAQGIKHQERIFNRRLQVHTEATEQQWRIPPPQAQQVEPPRRVSLVADSCPNPALYPVENGQVASIDEDFSSFALLLFRDAFQHLCFQDWLVCARPYPGFCLWRPTPSDKTDRDGSTQRGTPPPAQQAEHGEHGGENVSSTGHYSTPRKEPAYRSQERKMNDRKRLDRETKLPSFQSGSSVDAEGQTVRNKKDDCDQRIPRPATHKRKQDAPNRLEELVGWLDVFDRNIISGREVLKSHNGKCDLGVSFYARLGAFIRKNHGLQRLMFAVLGDEGGGREDDSWFWDRDADAEPEADDPKEDAFYGRHAGRERAWEAARLGRNGSYGISDGADLEPPEEVDGVLFEPTLLRL
ncbi:hypothetical protein AYO20_11401 [Fonsecaea nubica]|uniref:Uncharacterized protein n=1 Tax=Fonsecaea nubica TaxID=856822 RepID=A0A178BX70_9EURO|nr:hypothetical protein AYO20_11401 [Fonsecaea nubica]OAL21283.1 hypothetical protein AYO20_11401 [Fonsecaea nubica]